MIRDFARNMEYLSAGLFAALVSLLTHSVKGIQAKGNICLVCRLTCSPMCDTRYMIYPIYGGVCSLQGKVKTPVQAIRAHCLQCSYSAHEVKLCPAEGCPLHPFRFGKNPYTKRRYTDEQRRQMAARLADIRTQKKENCYGVR